MRNASVWAMILAAAVTVPVLAGGRGFQMGRERGTMTNRVRNALPSMPMGSGSVAPMVRGSVMPAGSGSGRIIQLNGDYAILDENTSIFSSTRGVTEPPPIAQPRNNTSRNLQQERAQPVFRAALFDDNGPVALMEVPDDRGGTKTVYLREGETCPWDGSRVLEITADKLRLTRPSYAGTTWVDVAIGRDLNGQQVGALPTSPSYVSADMAGRTENAGTSTTTFGRGRMGAGNTRSNFFGNGMNFGFGNTGSVMAAPLTTPAAPSTEPPLPPGSADDIATRMAERRQSQLSELTTPTFLPTTSNVR